MIEQIKETIQLQFSLTEPRGIFLSAFDKDKNLISSHGVISTNKPLWTVIDMIYHGIIEPQQDKVSSLICDIVWETKILNTMEEISNTNIKEYGICISTIDHTKSGILLPNTEGIDTISKALQIVKDKNHIEWNIILYAFTSTKIEITIQ